MLTLEARRRMNEHLSDFDLAQALSLVTQAVPGVASVYGGQLSAIATYGPGGACQASACAGTPDR